MRRFAERAGAALLLAGLLAACTGTEGPDPDPTGGATARPAGAASPDFDGDGTPDLAIGVGSATAGVRIEVGSGATRTITRADLDGVDTGTFGSALLAADLTADGRTDLVIGDPATQAAAGVWIIPGGATGPDLDAAITIPVPPGVAGFGAALALLREPVPTLAVGAPWDTAEAPGGAVVTYTLAPSGQPTGEPSVLRPGEAPLAGLTPRRGDAFGTALAASGTWLAVGAPRRDVEGVRDAGEVSLVSFGDEPQRVSRLDAAMADGAELAAEDRFGTVLAADDQHVVVGVPLSDLAGRNAGAVHVFDHTADGFVARPPLTSTAVDRTPTPGDLFGAGLAVGEPCAGTAGVAAGAPGATTDGVALAGFTALLAFDASGCPGVALTEGGGLGGTPTELSSLGRAVTLLADAGNGGDQVVIAAPGSAEEGVASRVLVAPAAGGTARVIDVGRLAEEGVLTLPVVVR